MKIFDDAFHAVFHAVRYCTVVHVERRISVTFCYAGSYRIVQCGAEIEMTVVSPAPGSVRRGLCVPWAEPPANL